MNDIIAIDTETGGLYSSIHALLSVAVVTSWEAEPLTIYVLPEPGKVIDARAAEVNGYTPELWEARGAVPLHRGLLQLGAYLKDLFCEKRGAALVAHHAAFDKGFLDEACRPFDIQLPGRYDCDCSMWLMGRLIKKGRVPPGPCSLNRLGDLSGFWQKEKRSVHHDAAQDARACLHGYQWLASLEPARRTDLEIVQQTEDLARLILARAFRLETEGGKRICNSNHPQGRTAWELACAAQELLTATDPENALAELGDLAAAA